MGDLIGKASSDDLLACFLWEQEGRIASRGCTAMKEIRDHLRERRDTMRASKYSDLQNIPFAQAEYREAVNRATAKMSNLIWKVSQAWQRASDLFVEMRNQFGFGSFVAQWERGSDWKTPLEEIGISWDESLAAKREAEKVQQGLDADLADVRALNSRRARFYENETKFTLDEIDNFDHKNFEILVRWLADRDGMKAWRTGGSGDLGADVIADTPDGRRIVFQCKHNKGNRSVDSGAVQRLNGTARPVHKADIVVMVASGQFSEPASKFARSQNIHMISRETLRAWSEWGDSLYFLLGIPEPPSQDEGETS